MTRVTRPRFTLIFYFRMMPISTYYPLSNNEFLICEEMFFAGVEGTFHTGF